jgi:hypothetical protein
VPQLHSGSQNTDILVLVRGSKHTWLGIIAPKAMRRDCTSSGASDVAVHWLQRLDGLESDRCTDMCATLSTTANQLLAMPHHLLELMGFTTTEMLALSAPAGGAASVPLTTRPLVEAPLAPRPRGMTTGERVGSSTPPAAAPPPFEAALAPELPLNVLTLTPAPARAVIALPLGALPKRAKMESSGFAATIGANSRLEDGSRSVDRVGLSEETLLSAVARRTWSTRGETRGVQR